MIKLTLILLEIHCCLSGNSRPITERLQWSKLHWCWKSTKWSDYWFHWKWICYISSTETCPQGTLSTPQRYFCNPKNLINQSVTHFLSLIFDADDEFSPVKIDKRYIALLLSAYWLSSSYTPTPSRQDHSTKVLKLIHDPIHFNISFQSRNGPCHQRIQTDDKSLWLSISSFYLWKTTWFNKLTLLYKFLTEHENIE